MPYAIKRNAYLGTAARADQGEIKGTDPSGGDRVVGMGLSGFKWRGKNSGHSKLRHSNLNEYLI